METHTRARRAYDARAHSRTQRRAPSSAGCNSSPRPASPASRPRAIALHSDARCRGACVKSARGGAGYGGEDRDCCRPPAPSSHRQPLGRARRPHRATSERATPDPTRYELRAVLMRTFVNVPGDLRNSAAALRILDL